MLNLQERTLLLDGLYALMKNLEPLPINATSYERELRVRKMQTIKELISKIPKL